MSEAAIDHNCKIISIIEMCFSKVSNSLNSDDFTKLENAFKIYLNAYSAEQYRALFACFP